VVQLYRIILIIKRVGRFKMSNRKTLSEMKNSLKKMDDFEVMRFLFGHPLVAEIINENIVAVRDYISNVLSGDAAYYDSLGDTPDIATTIVQQSVKSELFLRGEEVQSVVRPVVERNVKRCYEIYRHFALLAEVMKYLEENSDYNCMPSNLELSDIVEETIKICNELLEPAGRSIELDAEHELFMTSHKERLIFAILTLIQLAFVRYPDEKKLRVELKSLDAENMQLSIMPTDASFKDYVKSNSEVRDCERVLECFCDCYNCSFETREIERNHHKKGFYLTVYPGRMPRREISVCVAEPSEKLKELYKSDLFSPHRIALSKVLNPCD